METEVVNSQLIDYAAIFVQFVVAAGFVLTTIYFAQKIGPKHKSVKKFESFECGLDSIGNARLPFSVKYFLVAILFVLFDVEVIFFYPWAVNFRELGESGFVKMLAFIAPLLLGYFYIIKKGALKWE
ncbi:MAG: NADH-quinone oxidoreductase subunit A [Chitinophagales bacterium]|jgi:NADH-quinone oxidoreductase subunit A|nr:NADH-quinone oxidoreductase subunit A [Bacteroidota bacterium]MBP9881300.1 NADH-quinone oxidoreductase subunit A [Chitinophagales bacterium]MBK9504924.1 NADH-quinone oxidoreductase subunit A [Bacteroidota bacterium]MBK9555931.1 NADH-quinone oxidoreductase subunit A [Bacteroidota bacterium]MBL0279297.1 NADH-quinone oxidoreductase subunit A [Bacteroidota bacterium]